MLLSHLLDHAEDALAGVAHVSEIDEAANDPGVPADVGTVAGQQPLDGHGGRERAGARDLHAVVEQPDIHTPALDAVVAVSEGIEERLTPGEVGVLGDGPEEGVVAQTGGATDAARDGGLGVGEDVGQGALDAGELLHVVLGSSPAVGADDMEDPNPGVGMADHVPREKQLGGLPELERGSFPVGEAAPEQVVPRGQAGEPGVGLRLVDQAVRDLPVNVDVHGDRVRVVRVPRPATDPGR